MNRVITLSQAKTQYVHRFTCQHVPAWAKEQRPDGTFYAPHYATDEEWYENTMFPGEGFVGKGEKHCLSSKQSWPLGQSLSKPFRN